MLNSLNKNSLNFSLLIISLEEISFLSVLTKENMISHHLSSFLLLLLFMMVVGADIEAPANGRIGL